MAVLELERRIKARVATVWSVVADLSTYAGTAPSVTGIEVTGGEAATLTRRLRDASGHAWDERCTQWSEQDLACAVELTGGGFPLAVDGLSQSWRLSEDAGYVRISLTTEYTPSYGPVGAVLDALKIRDRLDEAARALLDAWVKAVREREWSYRVNVATILARKGNNVVTVAPADPVADVVRVLATERIGAVLVIGGDGKLLGILSERDVVRCIADTGADALSVPAEDIMTRKLVVCAPEDDSVHVMACMTDHRVRHLPVLDGDRLVGVISIGDVVKERIGSLEAESETMREYIAAREWRYHNQPAPAAGDAPGGL